MRKIETLAGEFLNLMELKSFSDKQFVLLRNSQERIQQLEEEVTHLKSLLDTTAPLEAKLRLDVSNEQVICEIQIEKLKRSAMERELTLEETKKFDLLTKNLYLAKGQSTAIIADFNKTSLPAAALLELVESEDSSGDQRSS